MQQEDTHADESFYDQPTVEEETPTVQMPARQPQVDSAAQENAGDPPSPQSQQYSQQLQNQPYSPYSSQPTQSMTPEQEAAYRAQQQRNYQAQQQAAYQAQQHARARRAAAGEERASTTAYAIAKLIDYLGWVLLVLEVVLALRFLLKLIGANPFNPFTSFLYGLSNIFLFIFHGIVTNPTFGAAHAEVFEVTTLIAMIVYGLIYLLLKLLLRTAISGPNEPIA